MIPTIITTCKGRLAFLKQTLPAMVATGLPITVVDYDCPQGTAGFVTTNFPNVNVVRITDRPLFNHAEARNLGAGRAATDVLAFVDADVMLSPGVGEFVRQNDFMTDVYFIGDGSLDATVVGVCIVARKHFARIGGYDECMAGWGYEDIDFYVRLRASGLERRFLPHHLIAPIAHANDLRVAFAEEKDQEASHRLNRLYSRIKIDMEGIVRRNLSVTERQRIRTLVEDAITTLIAKSKGAVVPLSIPLSEERFGGVARFTRSLTYSLTLA